MTNARSYNSPHPHPAWDFSQSDESQGEKRAVSFPRAFCAAGPGGRTALPTGPDAHPALCPRPGTGAGLGVGRAGGGGAGLLRPSHLQGCAGAPHPKERGPRRQPNATPHPGPRSTGPPPRARPALRTGPPHPRHEPGACRRGGRRGGWALLSSLRCRSGGRGTRAGGVKKDADPNAGRGRGAGGGRRRAGDGADALWS